VSCFQPNFEHLESQRKVYCTTNIYLIHPIPNLIDENHALVHEVSFDSLRLESLRKLYF